jgi:hypothetical protein
MQASVQVKVTMCVSNETVQPEAGRHHADLPTGDDVKLAVSDIGTLRQVLSKRSAPHQSAEADVHTYVHLDAHTDLRSRALG